MCLTTSIKVIDTVGRGSTVSPPQSTIKFYESASRKNQLTNFKTGGDCLNY